VLPGREKHWRRFQGLEKDGKDSGVSGAALRQSRVVD